MKIIIQCKKLEHTDFVYYRTWPLNCDEMWIIDLWFVFLKPIGKGAFEKSGAKKNFATIGVVYPEVLQIFSSEKLGANSLADLKVQKGADRKSIV